MENKHGIKMKKVNKPPGSEETYGGGEMAKEKEKKKEMVKRERKKDI